VIYQQLPQSGNLLVYVFTQRPKINILHPVGKTMHWTEKIVSPLRMGMTSSNHHAKLGGRPGDRTTRTGSRC